MREFIVFCVLCFTAVQASATTLPYKSWKDLFAEADGVVTGTVKDVQSTAADGDVYSFVTLTGVSMLAGDYQGDVLTLRIQGGMVKNNGQHLLGSPNFRPGERVILFVLANGDYAVPLVGWGQGVFRLQRDPASGREWVSDADGNGILEIRDGHVIKERRVSGEANILGAPDMIRRYEGKGDGHAGSSDNGTAGLKPIVPTGPPMSLVDFVGAIKRDVQGQPVTKRSVRSVAVGATPAARDTLDLGEGAKVDRATPVEPVLPSPMKTPAPNLR
jgi:hypothetical protein